MSTVRTATALAATVALLAVAGTALACGGDPSAQNLVATPQVKAALHRAYLVRHPGARVDGPVRGRTYYGAVAGDRYAVATFRVAGRETKPVILVRHDNRADRWHVVRETRGGICARFVPDTLLISEWHLQPAGRGCFVGPTV